MFVVIFLVTVIIFLTNLRKGEFTLIHSMMMLPDAEEVVDSVMVLPDAVEVVDSVMMLPDAEEVLGART